MLYSKLTEQDIERFRSYVEEFAISEDSTLYRSTMGDPRHILRFWNTKEDLFHLLGDNLIVEREIEIAEPRTRLESRIYNSIESGEMSEFHEKVYNQLDRYVHLFSDEYYFILRLFSSRDLASNIASSLPRNHTVTFKDGQTLKLTNTAKNMKLLGKLAKIMGLEPEFEKFRIAHSMILNQKLLKGTLCLSIHPMDYITMSDNDNNWVSCMNWQSDGDYRIGTVEMMNSPYVIVAYLRSSDKVYTWGNDQEWNSKVWRTLLIAHPELLVSVKSYPYEHSELTQLCIEWLRELATKNLGWNFNRPVQKMQESSNFDYQGEQCSYICNSNRMYNDFNAQTHYGCLADGIRHVHLNYSGTDECMMCGDTSCMPEDYNFVVCENCCDGSYSHYYCCNGCSCREHEDYIYWVEDTPLCESCFESLAASCDITGEYYFVENMRNVYLSRIKDAPDEEDESLFIGAELVNEDYYAYQSSDSWLKWYVSCAPHYDEQHHFYYWNIEDLTQQGLKCWFRIHDEKEVTQYRGEASPDRLEKTEK